MSSTSVARVALCAALAGVAYACGHDQQAASADVPLPASIDGGATTTTATATESLSCRAPKAAPPFVLTDVFGSNIGFTNPTTIARAGSTYFVGEQSGVIHRIVKDAAGAWTSSVYLDVSDDVIQSSMGDGGFIGLEPSPDFATTGELFITYTGTSETHKFRTRVARVQPLADGSGGDRATMEDVLSIERDYDGHNGGKIEFGPDRMLYVAIGDGWFGDPMHRAQDLTQIFGKLLRIDVLGTTRPYAVPADNPFVGSSPFPEIWAYGFRNPWSWNFDSTGRIWLGDVGQDHWEEVDLVTKGGNYGWSVREGKHCYLESPCDVDGAIDPVWDYPHVDGFAVTGGYVYAGQNPSLKGLYVFGDYITGRVWSLDATNPAGADTKEVVDTGLFISGWGQDENGELLMTDWGGGHVWRLDPNPDAGTPEQATLASLGCISTATPGSYDPSLVPYDVNTPLWSDGLDKRRFVKTPAGTTFHVKDDGSFEAPPGTLLMKEFSSAGKRVETRMFYNDPTYGWQPYTFAWKDDQSDAVLLMNDGQTTTLADGSTWEIPSRAQCQSCHRREVNNVLGFLPQQLNKGDQLTTLSNAGLFDAPLGPGSSARFAAIDDTTATVDARARSYLHANCAHCHYGGLMDLQDWTPLEDMHVLCQETSFSGGTDDTAASGVIANPGDPASSLIVQRMKGADGDRMPPLGTKKIDDAAVALITQWIGGLTPCTTITPSTGE